MKVGRGLLFEEQNEIS